MPDGFLGLVFTPAFKHKGYQTQSASSSSSFFCLRLRD